MIFKPNTRIVLQSLTLIVATFALTGCKAAGVVLYKVVGPMPVEAKYVPAKEPMLVMVERYKSPAATKLDCETLAREIYKDLLAHDVAQQIDPVLAMDLESNNPEKFKAMTISQIGAAVTAKQVMYVRLTSLVVNSLDGGAVIQGSASATVKIVDVATGQLRWPTDTASGYPVRAEIPVTMTRDVTPAAVNANLMREIAYSASRLFYKWQPEDDSPRDE